MQHKHSLKRLMIIAEY